MERLASGVSAQTWDELLEDTYRTPCGLEVLGYGNHFQQVFVDQGGSDLFGYPRFVNGSASDIEATGNPNIEGGGYTTIADYAEVLLMHLRGGRCANGRVLSEDAVEQMQRDRIAAAYDGDTGVDGRGGYGLGWWVHREEPGVFSDFGAYGAAPWIDLGRGYGVMLLVEADGGTGFAAMNRLKPVVEAILDGG